ncbi:sugar phosphate isomerase/epimerase family protein [Mucilaginibacter sp.]|jgi:sugar phosphate isomerase/epimerase|uniref:sugar phosphate isomerase/epimerase family protein n=1 Tax=Mucilaginibacter sp. TaxID=1882438 RepID=UPI00356B435C
MTNRRSFLKLTGAAALGGLLLPKLSRAGLINAPGYKNNIGIQLYTLSDLMVADAKGTLQKVAGIGFKELESAGSPKGSYYGYTPKEFKAITKDLGLHWRSNHVSGAPFEMAKLEAMIKKNMGGDDAKAKQMMERFKYIASMPTLKNDYQKLVDESAEGGLSYLVCASIPVGSLDEMKTAVEIFNKTGEACKKAGIQFAYHNHATEFDLVEGHRPFDYILSNTDKDLVKMELDLGWATKAGQDPKELFKQHPGRFPLWHAKDMDKINKAPAEVGTGIVDFKSAFDHAKDAGMKYFFVEQDQAPQPLQNITNSYNYLKKLLA